MSTTVKPELAGPVNKSLTRVTTFTMEVLVVSPDSSETVTVTKNPDGMWVATGGSLPSRYLQLFALIDDAIKETDKGGRVFLHYGINREAR